MEYFVRVFTILTSLLVTSLADGDHSVKNDVQD